MTGRGLWKVESGAFAGWQDDDRLYDAQGCHVGHFEGDTAYSTEGEYLGEIYRDDWIGSTEDIEHPTGSVECSLDSITAAPLPDRQGLEIEEGWSDPAF